MGDGPPHIGVFTGYNQDLANSHESNDPVFETEFRDRLSKFGVAQDPLSITGTNLTILNDPSKFYLMNSASAQTVTFPSGLTGLLPGMVLTFIILGAGQSTFNIDMATTVHNQSGITSLVSNGQYSICQFLNIGPDIWIALSGGFN